MNEPKRKKHSKAVTPAELDQLIEEAVVDAYNESEQITGFYTMIDENLVVPFMTENLGVAVTVEKVDLTGGEQIVAVCRRGRLRQRVSILDLPLPEERPEGAEWMMLTGDGRGGDSEKLREILP